MDELDLSYDVKICNTCDKMLPIADFYKIKNKIWGDCNKCRALKKKKWYNTNSELIKDRVNTWRKNNKTKVGKNQWKSKLKRFFKISENDYENMLQAQNGKCKICKKKTSKNRLAVDHCHKTGKVRGLLCNKCNGGLGNFNDSIEDLQRAINYLKEYEQ